MDESTVSSDMLYTLAALLLQDKAVEILSQHMYTDLPTSFGHSFINLCGNEISKMAAQRCFSDVRRTIHDVDVLELHDCFAPNEVGVVMITASLQRHRILVEHVCYVCTYVCTCVCPLHSDHSSSFMKLWGCARKAVVGS